MTDDPPVRPIRPPVSDDTAHVPVSPHLLTWWFGLMATGGVGFGWYAEQQPFGHGILAHPLVVFGAFVAAGLATVRFLHNRPMLELISLPALLVGGVIGVACFFLGNWFGASLSMMP